MKRILFFSILTVIFGTGCSRQSVTIGDLDASLAKQFKQQWRAKKDPADQRVIKDARLGRFYTSGNCNYVEIEVVTNGARLFSASPIVPLGKAFAVSFEVPETRQNLNAVIGVER